MAKDGHREIKRGSLGETFYVLRKDDKEIFDRDDGPACIYVDGSYTYYHKDQSFRTDGLCAVMAGPSHTDPTKFTFNYRPGISYPSYISAKEFADWYLVAFLREYEWLEEKAVMPGFQPPS